MSDVMTIIVMRIGYVAMAVLFPTFVIAGETVQLDRGVAPRHPQQPQVAVDGRGDIHVVYGVGNTVRYRRSTDGGVTFDAPVDLPITQVISLGRRRGPRIAAVDDAVCMTVIGGLQGKGRDGDVLAFRSGDGGITWAGPSTVNDAADSAREGLHALAAGPNGELCCAWLDLRNRRTEIMASMSTDGGSTWSKNTLVYRSPDGNVCECCHPSIAFDGKGRIHVLWRNSLAGARDMYVAVSVNQGKTFGPAGKLGFGSWPLKACPMDGGAIAAAGERVGSAWRRDRGVYLVDGRGDERLLGAGEQPWIAMTEKGPFIVWLKKRGDAAYLLTPGAKAPIQLAAQAGDPVIVAGPDGRGPVVAVWESRTGNNYAVECQVILE